MGKNLYLSDTGDSIPNIWINELHYDNIGTDVNEFVEVVIENDSAYLLSDMSLSLYNGANGRVYNAEKVSNLIAGQSINGFTVYTWKPPMIQNGPDGISLSYKNNCISFISYENVFTATEGPAKGLTSVKISIYERPSTPVGNSLQLNGSGNRYSQFSWILNTESPEKENNYQVFGEYIPPVPLNYMYMIILFLIIVFSKIFRNIKWSKTSL